MSEIRAFYEVFAYQRENWAILHGWRDIRKTTRGDCNDFAWTVLVISEGSPLKALKAVWTGKAVFCLAKSPENDLIPRHVVLRLGGAFIDSTRREWRDTPAPHRVVARLAFPWVLFRVTWGLVA